MNESKKIFLATVLVVLLAQANLSWSELALPKPPKLPSNVLLEYQDAISKVLPGYNILRNEDVLQDEDTLRNFISPDEIAKRKKRKVSGYIIGRFNDDRIQDFAAWVVNTAIKKEKDAIYPSEDYFAARLVVCLGTNKSREYQCEILPTLGGNFITLPYWADLVLVNLRGVVSCGDADHQKVFFDQPITTFYPEGWKGKRPSSGRGEMNAHKLRLNYDAIGEWAIGSNAGRTLIRGSDGVYLECASGD